MEGILSSELTVFGQQWDAPIFRKKRAASHYCPKSNAKRVSDREKLLISKGSGAWPESRFFATRKCCPSCWGCLGQRRQVRERSETGAQGGSRIDSSPQDSALCSCPLFNHWFLETYFGQVWGVPLFPTPAMPVCTPFFSTVDAGINVYETFVVSAHSAARVTR